VLEILQQDKIWGQFALASPLQILGNSSPVSPRDLRPWSHPCLLKFTVYWSLSNECDLYCATARQWLTQSCCRCFTAWIKQIMLFVFCCGNKISVSILLVTQVLVEAARLPRGNCPMSNYFLVSERVRQTDVTISYLFGRESMLYPPKKNKQHEFLMTKQSSHNFKWFSARVNEPSCFYLLCLWYVVPSNTDTALDGQWTTGRQMKFVVH